MQELFDIPDQYDEMLNKGIGVTGNDKNFFIEGRLNLLIQKLPKDFKPKRILDFGCGTGATSKKLSIIFPYSEIIGTDISKVSIDFASKEYQNENLNFLEFNDLKLIKPFDLVYLNCVIHHIDPSERGKTMELIFTSCKSEGYVFIFENNPANPGTQLAMYTNPFDKGVVKVWPSELKKRIKTSGFQFLDSFFIFYFPQWLSVFRAMEKYLIKIPLGGQYGMLAKKP